MVPSDIQCHKTATSRSAEACCQADGVLFSAGDMGAIDKACRSAPFGKLTRDALYVHVSGVAAMPALLRLYEGYARANTGDGGEGANVIKFHRMKPRISYLSYSNFDRKGHPELLGSLLVKLDSLDVRSIDYRQSENPPILHRKEELVASTYSHREKFATLTRREERAGLYEHITRIGTASGWQRTLEAAGVRIVGHRVKKI